MIFDLTTRALRVVAGVLRLRPTKRGTPAVTIPAYKGVTGLPVGIQLVGRIGGDAQLMEAALFAERALAEAA